jgi:G-patch domain
MKTSWFTAWLFRPAVCPQRLCVGRRKRLHCNIIYTFKKRIIDCLHCYLGYLSTHLVAQISRGGTKLHKYNSALYIPVARLSTRANKLTTMSHDIDNEDDEYFLPLQDQQVFGAGIRRKRVPFVRAESESSPALPAGPKLGLGDRYLAIVLPQHAENTEHPQPQPSSADKDEPASHEAICTVCNFPITTFPSPSSSGPTKPHESSLAHQVCLSHSHPPSHLDRDHIGLKYLSAYGWDPDARRGLGPRGTGIRVPVKSKIKNDTVGLGVKEAAVGRVRVQKEAKDKVRLNAKEMRKQEAAGKKREMHLRNAFYGRDLEAYLGPAG